MSHITRTALNRKFEAKTFGKKIKVVKNVRREKIIPALERFPDYCRGCGRKMLVSIGQIARFHRQCRNARVSFTHFRQLRQSR